MVEVDLRSSAASSDAGHSGHEGLVWHRGNSATLTHQALRRTQTQIRTNMNWVVLWYQMTSSLRCTDIYNHALRMDPSKLPVVLTVSGHRSVLGPIQPLLH